MGRTSPLILMFVCLVCLNIFAQMDLKLRVTRIHKQYLQTGLTHLHHVIADATLVMRTVLKKNAEQIALYTTIAVTHARLDFLIQS